MRRRTLLRTGLASGLALSLPASAVATDIDSTPQRADPESYDPLGHVSVEGAAEAVVGDDGETAYLATTTGFATVDVSDPDEPEVLATEDGITADGDPLTEILDVKVDGDRLVVPGPANEASGSVFHGFICYDVSDPADPVAATDPYETEYHIHNCYLEGDLLFVVANSPDTDENPLVVFDVSDDTVDELGRWSLLDHDPDWAEIFWLARYLHDVYVREEIAYLAYWNAGTYLLDVSDPAEPEYVSHVAETDLEEQREIDEEEEAQVGLPGNDHYSAVDDTGDILAVGREAWATGGDDPDGAGGIDLYDVSDPADPTHQAAIDAPSAEDESYDGGTWTTAHNFELRNDRLYSSWYQGGVKIHDVSDPASPTELASWRDAENAGFWTARVLDPGETIVASSTPLIPNAETEGALYTFPVVTGDEGDDEDDTIADSIPGFTAVAGATGLAGGALGLEWLRRRRGDGTQQRRE